MATGILLLCLHLQLSTSHFLVHMLYVCMYVRMVCIQQWMMTLAHDAEQSEWLCTAERPSGRSYLFFEEFKLQVAGAQLQQVTAEASSQFHVTLVTLRTS